MSNIVLETALIRPNVITQFQGISLHISDDINFPTKKLQDFSLQNFKEDNIIFYTFNLLYCQILRASRNSLDKSEDT